MINNLLGKYLKKQGVTEFSQLTEEEKQTYREWDEVLSGRKLTDDDVKLFLDTEIEETTKKLITLGLSDRQDTCRKLKRILHTYFDIFAWNNRRRFILPLFPQQLDDLNDLFHQRKRYSISKLHGGGEYQDR